MRIYISFRYIDYAVEIAHRIMTPATAPTPTPALTTCELAKGAEQNSKNALPFELTVDEFSSQCIRNLCVMKINLLFYLSINSGW